MQITLFSFFTPGETLQVLSHYARLTGTDQIKVALHVSVVLEELTFLRRLHSLQDCKKHLLSGKDFYVNIWSLFSSVSQKRFIFN